MNTQPGHDPVTVSGVTEEQFAALVDELSFAPERREQFRDLLRENHPLYAQRGTAATVRMRGWVLLAMARAGLVDAELLFVLEELDAGLDSYLVAAAAKALRSSSHPREAFAPYVMHALANVRYRDEPVSFVGYGAYADGSSEDDTSPVRELLLTLKWLKEHGRSALPELELLLQPQSGLSPELNKVAFDAQRTIKEAFEAASLGPPQGCCSLPDSLKGVFCREREWRHSASALEDTMFQDQDGTPTSFAEFFHGQPAIVVFFYTRCDNPLKCSLTVAKLARVQQLLEERQLAHQIRTAAITYDPGFDLPERLRAYGNNRGLRMNEHHRMLRSTQGMDTLKDHFSLGVNFVESLVNRHRIEAYILDSTGGIQVSLERIRWDERALVDKAEEVLASERGRLTSSLTPSGKKGAVLHGSAPHLCTIAAAVGAAIFPKCPVCWAAYLSVFGIAGLEQIPFVPWLLPILCTILVLNLASIWFRSRATGRLTPFWFVCLGAAIILISRSMHGGQLMAGAGLTLTIIGSLLSALGGPQSTRPADKYAAQHRVANAQESW
ncbi:MAG: SCO family protein [Verrucomicrobiales bacterium]